jgi:hypothetical protein
MHTALRICLSSLLILMSAASIMPANASGTPKDMFYQELKGADNSGSATVAYCLELHRGNGAPTLCNNRYPFKSGDGIRLHIKSTIPGYAYIALIGSTGQKSVIYPPTPDEDNRIEPGKEVLVPGKGMIVFDNNPGTEQLYVMLSPQPVDMSRSLDSLSGPSVGGDLLSGLPVKVGNYELMSNDGFYDLGEKTPGAGLVYVTNPDASKPTVIALALNHGGSGTSAQAAGNSGTYNGGGNGGGAGNASNNSGNSSTQVSAGHPAIKTRYYVPALHNDARQNVETSEVYRAFRKVPGRRSGIDCGARDQYIAALNHMYANYVMQQVRAPQGAGSFCYLQETPGRSSDTGERLTYPDFKSGQYYPSAQQPEDDPGTAASFDGMAYIEKSLSGGKANLLGGQPFRQSWQDPAIYLVVTGHDLDAAWDANGKGPLIIGVDCRASMFGSGTGDRIEGHVVVLSERRQKRDGPGRTSNYEYRLLNSWGRDNDGRLRNGWVSGDAAASAMNYIDKAHDESTNPHKALDPDELPIPGFNELAHGNDGLKLDLDRSLGIPLYEEDGSRMFKFKSGGSRGSGGRAVKGAQAEAAELMKHASAGNEGFTPEDLSVLDASVKAVLTNKTEDGDRPYPMSEENKAGVLHEANRLFLDSAKVYAQGFDQGDRNRALIAMVHDNAYPEHINQGAHNTCNVTTIMKIETLLRPAAQAKRFVDLYTNANNDNSFYLF